MTMKLLMHGMRQLRDQEAFLAVQIHGKTFPTFPEGYTALLEELQEAQDEVRRVECSAQIILRLMREPNPRTQEEMESSWMTWNTVLSWPPASWCRPHTSPGR